MRDGKREVVRYKEALIIMLSHADYGKRLITLI